MDRLNPSVVGCLDTFVSSKTVLPMLKLSAFCVYRVNVPRFTLFYHTANQSFRNSIGTVSVQKVAVLDTCENVPEDPIMSDLELMLWRCKVNIIRQA